MTINTGAVVSETDPSGKKLPKEYGINLYQAASEAALRDAKSEIYSKGDPSDSKGGLSEINRNLQKLFVF